MAALDGAVFGSGGLPPVTRTTAPITTTRQASQPRMKARPFLVPFSVLSSRMKAVSGKGSRVMPRPMRRRSATIWLGSRYQRGERQPSKGAAHRTAISP
jgi:hypothetical protein